MRGAPLGLACLMLLAPTVVGATSAQEQAPSLALWAHWPSDLGTAMEAPIPVTTMPPAGEPDLSAGPATPGASATGTVPTFTYRLINPNGTDGPFGDVALDPSRPVIVDFYLSADETPWPAAAGGPPEDVDAGVVPEMTVEATLRIGDETVAKDAQTQLLVTAPEPAGAPAQRYVFELPFERSTLEKGEGLFVDFEIYQVDEAGHTVTQPGFNVHTGDTYPTHVRLPVPASSAQDATSAGDLELASYSAETRETRVVAVGVLIASVLTAALAGLRLVRLRS